MRFRPFKLLNSSERSAVAGFAETTLDAWQQAWVAAPAAVAGAACDAAAEHNELRLETDWLSFSASGATLYVANRKRAVDILRSAIAGDASGGVAGENSMAAKLGQISLQDLAERLMGSAVDASDAAPPPELWLRGSGAACIALTLGDGEVAAVFDNALVTKLLPRQQRPTARPATLGNPQQCIGRQPVEIRVWLGSTDIDLSTFQTLAVNDVLLLDTRIDRPLRITVSGREAAPHAVLGRVQQHRAIRLTTYSPDH